MSRRRVLVYLRISKSDMRSQLRPGATPGEVAAAAEAERLSSLAKQRTHCRRVAAERFHGFEVVEFVDDGVSGSKSHARAGLTALLAELARGGVDAVIVDTLDRLTRDRGARTMWETAAACEKVGAELVGASQEIDLTTSSGELNASIMAAAARFEARRTADRVKATNQLRAVQGWAPAGGAPPWGSLKEGRGYKPDPRVISGADGQQSTRADVVRDAVARMVAGEASFNGLAGEWTRAGWPTPQGSSSTWRASTVRNVLTAPGHAGMVRRRGELLRGDDGLPIAHPGSLLTVGEWTALQAAVADRALGPRPPRPTELARPRREYPLLHRLARDEAGHVLYQQHARPPIAARYTCRASGCSLYTTVLLEELDSWVTREWLEARGNDGETEAVVPPASGSDERLAALRREVLATTSALSSARDADSISTLAARLVRLRGAEDEVLTGEVGDRFTTVRSTGRTLAEAWEAADVGGRRTLLSMHIHMVVVGPGLRGGPGGRSRPLEERARILWDSDIDWNAAVIERQQGG